MGTDKGISPGWAQIVAEVDKNETNTFAIMTVNILSVFERMKCIWKDEHAAKNLSKIVVMLILFSNDKVLGIFHDRMPATDAFFVSHGILSHIIVVLLELSSNDELSMLNFLMSKPPHRIRALF